jgi:hypothetical protein
MFGLSPMEECVGYKKTRIAPKTDPQIQRVRMIRETAAGRYEIEWEFRPTTLHFRVVVPFDCKALILIPGRAERWVNQGEYTWDNPLDTQPATSRDPHQEQCLLE